jgi:hypothetical protein
MIMLSGAVAVAVRSLSAEAGFGDRRRFGADALTRPGGNP